MWGNPWGEIGKPSVRILLSNGNKLLDIKTAIRSYLVVFTLLSICWNSA
jgi:hypothetical protein